jgi:hypothetical protein
VITAALGESEEEKLAMSLLSQLEQQGVDPDKVRLVFLAHRNGSKPKLVNAPVRSDAKITSGKDTLKLKDFQAGNVLSLQLATDHITGVVIVGIRLVARGLPPTSPDFPAPLLGKPK